MTAAVFSHNMPDEATYWQPGVNDGFGGVVFGAPDIVRCRWQDVNALARAADGREFMCSSIIYVNQAVELRGYLARGDFTYVGDPRNASGAREIRTVESSFNVAGTVILYKALL